MVYDTGIELKPRGVMELFDQALRLYRNNFLKFIGIIAIAQVPIQLVQMLLNLVVFQSMGNGSEAYTANLAMLGGSTITLIISILSYIFVAGLATAALTRAIIGRYLGEEVTIFGAYEKIKDRWGSLVGALLLVSLASIPLLIWALVPCIGWITGFGMLFFLALVVTPLIAPIIVIEGRGASRAIRRGWELARRRFWWLTGFFLLLMLFNLLVVQGPVYAVTAAITGIFVQGAESANLASSSALQTIVTSLLALILSLLYVPLSATCATLAYFDLRVRQEGIDLALMAGQGDGVPVNAMALAGESPAIPAGPLVTWPEMANFALVSLIVAVFYGILYAALMVFIFAAYGFNNF
jgi:hypothetical protein